MPIPSARKGRPLSRQRIRGRHSLPCQLNLLSILPVLLAAVRSHQRQQPSVQQSPSFMAGGSRSCPRVQRWVHGWHTTPHPLSQSLLQALHPSSVVRQASQHTLDLRIKANLQVALMGCGMGQHKLVSSQDFLGVQRTAERATWYCAARFPSGGGSSSLRSRSLLAEVELIGQRQHSGRCGRVVHQMPHT